MRTTIDIPDELFRRTKAAAAMRGETLKDMVAAALRAFVDEPEARRADARGWRSVFGRAKPSDVRSVDRAVAHELERINPKEWA